MDTKHVWCLRGRKYAPCLHCIPRLLRSHPRTHAVGDGHFYSVCSRNELTNAYLFLSPRFRQLGFLLQISPPSIVSQVPSPQPLRSLPSSPFFSPWQLLVPSLTLPLGLSPVSFLSLTQQSQGQQATVQRPALTRL